MLYRPSRRGLISFAFLFLNVFLFNEHVFIFTLRNARTERQQKHVIIKQANARSLMLIERPSSPCFASLQNKTHHS